MNVAFLLGNGFDLQLGLKTRYDSFYEYYRKKPSGNELISQLKEHINDYLEGKKNNLPDVNWEDLELALGKYTKELKSYEELRTVYLDINKELMAYLRMQERQFVKDENILVKLREDFSRPEKYLSINEKRRYDSLIEGSSNLFLYNLNYTHICEFIYDKKVPTTNSKGHVTNLGEITHVHGDLDMLNVLMGVNDVSQIANESFREDSRVKRMLVKPSTNNMLDNQKTRRIDNMLNNMKVIVIYGASLGDSDLRWKNRLRDLLKSENYYFLINEYQEGFDNIYDQTDAEEQAKESFIKKLGIDDNIDKYKRCVFVVVTKSMFKIVV
jgi:hypothetical protein